MRRTDSGSSSGTGAEALGQAHLVAVAHEALALAEFLGHGQQLLLHLLCGGEREKFSIHVVQLVADLRLDQLGILQLFIVHQKPVFSSVIPSRLPNLRFWGFAPNPNNFFPLVGRKVIK